MVEKGSENREPFNRREKRTIFDLMECLPLDTPILD